MEILFNLSPEATNTVTKVTASAINFSLIMITGNLPLRSKKFKSSKMLISFANAFSGGLFLAIGILHLLPEAQESFNKYYAEKGEGNEDHFPFANFYAVICFALLLFVERIAFDQGLPGHNHVTNLNDSDHIVHNSSEEHNHDLLKSKSQQPDAVIIQTVDYDDRTCEEKAADLQSPFIRKVKKMSLGKRSLDRNQQSAFAQEPIDEDQTNSLAPFILQIAIGIHATFEGMAIGIERNVAECLGIAVAVICHKWAEGLTLGIAFFRAKTDLKTASWMIFIQAVMNPVGIIIGWVLSSQGNYVRGIFEAASAGTFFYVATSEVITHEFSMARYKWIKFFIFCLAICFVVSLYFIEQVFGG